MRDLFNTRKPCNKGGLPSPQSIQLTSSIPRVARLQDCQGTGDKYCQISGPRMCQQHLSTSCHLQQEVGKVISFLSGARINPSSEWFIGIQSESENQNSWPEANLLQPILIQLCGKFLMQGFNTLGFFFI